MSEVTRTGWLVRQWDLGENTAYHAGGLTFDGEHVWVPLAEYRPDSRSIMYRLDPSTGEAEEQFRYADHVAGIARDAGQVSARWRSTRVGLDFPERFRIYDRRHSKVTNDLGLGENPRGGLREREASSPGHTMA
ncbi:hypothetical protein GCM10012286_06090 [Streptomyces lasiicapitis]|uniref:S9 family peptidase n=1 Tax=Streptomyces lasiicapitis TaxID=1923961 RepID=A0ABQ2LL44_9ACTN|nr:hypothetical protein GCM10012286_06090 [Streptomyces lasiicapitis]